LTHLHHPERHGVVLILDPDRGKLLSDAPGVGLQPGDQGLVALELRDHALAVGRRVERPIHAHLYHAVQGHVDGAHFFDQRTRFAGL
jgi:hypothetical protein